MPPQLVPSDEPAPHVACDALLVGSTSTGDGASLHESAHELDAALDGYLSEYLQESGFKAKPCEILVVPTFRRSPAKAVVVVGLGRDPDTSVLRRAGASAARRLSDRSVIASLLHQAVDDDAAACAAAEGLLLGCYRFTEYKSDPQPSKIQTMLVLGAPSEASMERAAAVAEATALARDLTNEPACVLSPDELARRAHAIADVSGLECTIFDEDAIVDKGFGGLATVGRGSAHPPRLIQLRYAPAKPQGRVVLIGKGITFDSGGLSLKDAKNMETMKTDMAGAAAAIGAMSVLQRLGPQIEVLALIPAAENMPSGNSVKPGDVIRHYGGRTTEVLNTDAEGRLVMADALAFAADQKPDAIVDIATLTGSMVVALGRRITGYFCTDDDLGEELEAAAKGGGEHIWRMPLFTDYKSELDSEVADAKNVGTRWGGAILAALYLREFVGTEVAWAHLDIAGPSRADSDLEEISKGGTGVATRTLISWLESRGS